ncbi:PpiD1 [Desulforapulum autotrophicum HRM2]|uniref:Periplasmic chaperone PpiD n=1 Tax=Desulforapulum autotrophicum (strain ATCC 43914 / DSM 3382 / VKM B-1955 / HRM2) TaxID=177437 RepID=C0QBW0_DESAH|nr:peptidylprolyl isomerase [Desulforapulum autotrophicum]ACN14972.1 PpiD1 [Desulforapulum autotrophicum HRM2]
MLKLMRENTGSWIIKILLGLIVLVFVFLGMGSIGAKRGNEVAMINDQPITLNEYQRSYQNIIEQMRQRFGDNLNDEILQMLQVKKQALDRLIDERLISGEADRLKVEVSNQELANSLLDIPAFRKNGVFDLATYKVVLSRNRMSPESFEAMQLQALREQKVRDLVFSTLSVSDQEARAWYTHSKTQVGIDYLVFNPVAYKDIAVDAKALTDFYESNKEKYKSEAELTVKYLEFAVKDYQDRVTISDDEIKAYYDENLDQYKVPEKVEARHILIRVPQDADEATVEAARNEAETIHAKAVGGEDFSLLAKTFSQGPTKDDGGYLGTFARDAMVKPFAEAAFSLASGEISKPVRTQFGWHVIKVEAKLPASTTALDKVAAEIRKTLSTAELKNLAYSDAGKAFDGIIDGDDLEQAGLITGKKVLTAGPFTQKGPGDVVADSQGFARAAFAMSLNEIGDVKEIGDNYYIIKPVEKIDPEVLPLEAVRDTVTKDLTAQLQQERAKKDAQAFLDELKDNKEIKAVAKAKGLEAKASSLFVRGATVPEFGPNSEITAVAFELSPENPVHPAVVTGSGGFYVISFREQKLPDAAEIDENLDGVKVSMARSKQGSVYNEWLGELKMAAKIDIKKGFLD